MNPVSSLDIPLVLVVGPYWVGDMVMAQSLFKLLTRRNPAPRIHVLAPDWTRPLLGYMPEVEATIPISLGHAQLGLGVRWRIAGGIREKRYDQAILLRNSWTSALIPWLARIPLRTGWVGELRYGLLNDPRQLDRGRLTTTVQRFAALAGPPGSRTAPSFPYPRLEVKAGKVKQTLKILGLHKGMDRPLLALCPGAEFGPAKRWPAPLFGRLARHLQQSGWDVWLFGSGNDRRLCEEVNGYSGGVCRNLAGRTSLGQAVELLSLADFAVSNDSGLMHVAAALDRPLVAIFGSSDPGHTPPLSERAKTVHLGLPCSPCFRRHCPLGHTDCLRRLSVERVMEAIDALINR